MFRNPTVVKVAVAALALSVPLASCGDDDEAATTTAATTTTTAATATTVHVITTEPEETMPADLPEDVAALFHHLDTECAGGDPGFDQFLAEHPEPTAEEWAGFLPEPIGMLTDVSSCIADSDPPADLADEIDAVVVAMNGVLAKATEALDAAESGDVEAVNARLEEMNSGLVQTMQDAEDAVLQAVQDR